MNKKLEKLIKLTKENPELEIFSKVHQDLFSDDWCWGLGSFGDCKIHEYYCLCEKIFLDDQIIDELATQFESDPESELLSEEEFDNVINKEIDNKRKCGEIKKAIFVEITLP